MLRFSAGPPSLREEECSCAPRTAVGEEDISAWPCSVDLVVKITAFCEFCSLVSEDKDLGVGGVSYLELLILCELWAGERLICEKSIPWRRRSGTAATASPGVEIWKSCWLLGCVLRFLWGLPGGFRRFLPNDEGSNHGRLRRRVWEGSGQV